MSNRVEFRPGAAEEADAALRWYAERSPGAAAGFESALAEAIHRIVEAPARWPGFHAGTRHVRMRRYPYTVVYVERPDRVEIVAGAHASRRPGYWRRR